MQPAFCLWEHSGLWWYLELCNSTAVPDLVFSSSPSCLSGWAVLICAILYHRATGCSHNFIYSSVTHRIYLYASPYSLIFLIYFYLFYHLCWWVGSLTWSYKSSVYLVLSFCYLIYLFYPLIWAKIKILSFPKTVLWCWLSLFQNNMSIVYGFNSFLNHSNSWSTPLPVTDWFLTKLISWLGV